jgi:hypothetical protein
MGGGGEDRFLTNASTTESSVSDAGSWYLFLWLIPALHFQQMHAKTMTIIITTITTSIITSVLFVTILSWTSGSFVGGTTKRRHKPIGWFQ